MLRRSFLKLAGACVLVPALRWVPTLSYADRVALRREQTWMAFYEGMENAFWNAPLLFDDSIEQPYMLEVLLRSGKRRHGVITPPNVYSGVAAP